MLPMVQVTSGLGLSHCGRGAQKYMNFQVQGLRG